MVNKNLYTLLTCLLLTGCDLIDYHPYDVRISGETDVNAHNIEQIEAKCKGKTTILIAHRISTVQHADLIMVLENGEMKELGTHTELIQKNGIYKDMFEKQQLEASIGEQEVAIR